MIVARGLGIGGGLVIAGYGAGTTGSVPLPHTPTSPRHQPDFFSQRPSRRRRKRRPEDEFYLIGM